MILAPQSSGAPSVLRSPYDSTGSGNSKPLPFDFSPYSAMKDGGIGFNCEPKFY